MSNPLLNSCRVCGYQFAGFFPWGKDEKSPSFSYCPCCFTEFGYDDVEIGMIKNKRTFWIEQGYKWYEQEKRPDGWDPVEQMKGIPEEYK